jgi:MFS family permease
MIREPRRGLPSPGAGFALANGARAFRHRNYRLFFGSQIVSLVGTWMQVVAQAWLVLELTDDPFLLGLVAAMQFLPVTILGLFGGLIADALPKRRTLIRTQAVQMTLAFILFARDRLSTWHIVALAAGVTNAVDMPTRQSFVPGDGGPPTGNRGRPQPATFNGARIVAGRPGGLVIRGGRAT